MRKILKDLLDARVNSILKRLEQPVTIESHLQLVERLLRQLNEAIDNLSLPSNLLARFLQLAVHKANITSSAQLGIIISPAISPPAVPGQSEIVRAIDLNQMINENRFESLMPVQTAHLLSLAGVFFEKEENFWHSVSADFERLFLREDGAESKLMRHQFRACFLYLFAGIKSGILKFGEVPPLLSQILSEITQNPKIVTFKGVLYGSGNLFRCFLHLVRANAPGISSMEVRQSCEIIMRHVEVKRELSLPFYDNPLPDDALPLLEKLNFTLALLDAADTFSDIRYLNTALKQNDWHFGIIRKMKLNIKSISNSAPYFIIFLLYISAIGEQERLIKKFHA